MARIDDHWLQSARQLFEILETVTPDQTLELEIWRDGSAQNVFIVAQEIPDDVQHKLARRLLGINLAWRAPGAYAVTSIRNGSPSDRVGVQAGDYVLAVNGLRLDGDPALKRAMLDLRGRERALIVVQRGAGRYHLVMPLR